MNIEVSELAIATLTLGLIVLTALWNRRGVRVRVSPRNVELDLEQPQAAITSDSPSSDSQDK